MDLEKLNEWSNIASQRLSQGGQTSHRNASQMPAQEGSQVSPGLQGYLAHKKLPTP